MKKKKSTKEEFIYYILKRGAFKKYSVGIKTKTWFNGAGNDFKIEDMSSNYIKNCIYFLTYGRNAKGTMTAPAQLMKVSSDYITLFRKELNERYKNS